MTGFRRTRPPCRAPESGFHRGQVVARVTARARRERLSAPPAPGRKSVCNPRRTSGPCPLTAAPHGRPSALPSQPYRHPVKPRPPSLRPVVCPSASPYSGGRTDRGPADGPVTGPEVINTAGEDLGSFNREAAIGAEIARGAPPEENVHCGLVLRNVVVSSGELAVSTDAIRYIMEGTRHLTIGEQPSAEDLRRFREYLKRPTGPRIQVKPGDAAKAPWKPREGECGLGASASRPIVITSFTPAMAPTVPRPALARTNVGARARRRRRGRPSSRASPAHGRVPRWWSSGQH